MTEDTLPKKNTTKANKIAGSTLIVMIGWGASIIVGLVRQRIIAGQFGTGSMPSMPSPPPTSSPS